MVFYYKARPDAGDYTIYMGADKNENEELIKYGLPEDVWYVPACVALHPPQLCQGFLTPPCAGSTYASIHRFLPATPCALSLEFLAALHVDSRSTTTKWRARGVRINVAVVK
jgi:hypothetical protein